MNIATLLLYSATSHDHGPALVMLLPAILTWLTPRFKRMVETINLIPATLAKVLIDSISEIANASKKLKKYV